VGHTGWERAKSFGYPTFWGNRDNQLAEELGVGPDAYGGDLNDLVTFLAACLISAGPDT